MNILINTDAYHITMGWLIENPLEMETHVLYARSGGPLVVPNLYAVLKKLVDNLPNRRQVMEADRYWKSQQVMFPKEAWLELVNFKQNSFYIHGVRDGEILLPGEPMAVIEAPALLAGIIEPYLIGEMMASVQLATRFTKLASAVNWDVSRIFEVGFRASPSTVMHEAAIEILSRVGLRMSSNGAAARAANIASGGTMGHRYTQRYRKDEAAFSNAIEKVLQYRQQNDMSRKSKLSFLLDTRDTLKQGLPAAIKVIQRYRNVIRQQISLSIRFDSGDLDKQLRAAIALIKFALPDSQDWPDIIMESGLTAIDVARFEAIAVKAGYPRRKMLYGVGGYLVGGIDRDKVSMVYKLTSFNGQATMKFGDEVDNGKTSYPGRFTLMERATGERVERCLVNESDIELFMVNGWHNIFIPLVKEGELVAKPVSSDLMQQWIQYRWKILAKDYIGDDKQPGQFPKRPRMSEGMHTLIGQLRS